MPRFGGMGAGMFGKEGASGGAQSPPGTQFFLVQTSIGVFEQLQVQTAASVFQNFAVKVS